MIIETVDTGIVWPAKTDNPVQNTLLTVWDQGEGSPFDLGIVTAYERIWFRLQDVPQLIQHLQALYDKYGAL